MNPITGSGRAVQFSANDPRFRGKRYRQLVAAFNVYRASRIVAESVPPPRIQTSFRGVPFACDARVLAVGQQDVTFALQRLQARAIERTRNSVIMSPLHGMSFKVVATGVDPDEGRASFSQFITQRRGATENRSNLRVEPENSIEVRLKCFDRERSGWLHDLSVVSLAVSLDEPELDGTRQGDMLSVHIPELAPLSGMSVEAKGKIIRTTPAAGRDVQSRGVVIYLHIDQQALYDRLERYIALRRVSLIRDLANSRLASDEEDAKPRALTREHSQD